MSTLPLTSPSNLTKRKNIANRLSKWWKRKQGYVAQENSPSRSTRSQSEDGSSMAASKSAAPVRIFDAPPQQACTFSIEDETVGASMNFVSPRNSDEISESTTTPPMIANDTYEDEYNSQDDLPPMLQRATRSSSSCQGSIESIDSLEESYWDPSDSDRENDDGDSLSLGISSRAVETPDFFEEHVAFLRQKTNARSVHVLWSNQTVPSETGTSAHIGRNDPSSYRPRVGLDMLSELEEADPDDLE